MRTLFLLALLALGLARASTGQHSGHGAHASASGRARSPQEIRGPAARVRLRGAADVAAETQDLQVEVQPTLSESVAIGAAASLVNPVAGVLTYLAQKALRDPIEKLFAYNYTITGTWSDPEVARSFEAEPPAAPAH